MPRDSEPIRVGLRDQINREIESHREQAAECRRQAERLQPVAESSRLVHELASAEGRTDVAFVAKAGMETTVRQIDSLLKEAMDHDAQIARLEIERHIN